MKIVINLLPYTNYSGVETVVKNLVIWMKKEFPQDDLVILKHTLSPEFLHFKDLDLKEEIIYIKKRRRGILAILQQIKIYSILKRLKPDILLSLSPSAPFFYSRNVIMIHDCAYDKYPEFTSFLSKIYSKLMYYVAKFLAKKIITISEFSKKELINLYKIKPDKIEVIYLGPPELPEIDVKFLSQTLTKFKLVNKKYFIYVGNTRPRKNIPGLLKAFQMFLEENHGFYMVLVGKIDNKFVDLDQEIKNLKLKNNVIRTGFVTDEEKVALYKGAIALTFPSYYEGFGLPVLEAQSLGIPVLTSNNSSLPEVAGDDSVVWVDPYKVENIFIGIKKITFDKKLRENLIKKGYENVKRFSWVNAAHRMIDIVRNIITEK